MEKIKLCLIHLNFDHFCLVAAIGHRNCCSLPCDWFAPDMSRIHPSIHFLLSITYCRGDGACPSSPEFRGGNSWIGLQSGSRQLCSPLPSSRNIPLILRPNSKALLFWNLTSICEKQVELLYPRAQLVHTGLATGLTWENTFSLHWCRLKKSAAPLRQEVVWQSPWPYSLRDNCASESCGLNNRLKGLGVRCWRYSSPADFMSLFSVILHKGHPKGMPSCFLIRGAAIWSTLYRVFSIRGTLKRAPLVFLNRATLGDSITDERVWMLFL